MTEIGSSWKGSEQGWKQYRPHWKGYRQSGTKEDSSGSFYAIIDVWKAMAGNRHDRISGEMVNQTTGGNTPQLANTYVLKMRTAQIIVSGRRSFEAAKQYAGSGKKIHSEKDILKLVTALDFQYKRGRQGRGRVLDQRRDVVVRGVRPFLSDKYDLTKHPNYYLTADADDRNTFDMEKFLSRKLKLRSNEEYTVIEA